MLTNCMQSYVSHAYVYIYRYIRFIRSLCTFVEHSYYLMVDLIPHLVDNSPLRSPVRYRVVL